jgi:pimeloyl-ACP methyl ester carboxylesterase
MDIWIPTGAGPFRTVVLVRGGPTGAGGRGYVEPFAYELAKAGVLVLNADMRDIAADGGGYPQAFQDVACAVRVARTWAPIYGGDGSATLVGHSLGGFVGSVVALEPDVFGGSCMASGIGRPDAFVGLSGNYDLYDTKLEGDLEKLYGGSAQDTATERNLSNPFAVPTGPAIPVFLLAGTSDTTVNPAAAVAMNKYLNDLGWPVSLTLVPNATHNSIIVPTQNGPDSLAVVLKAVAAIGS